MCVSLNLLGKGCLRVKPAYRHRGKFISESGITQPVGVSLH